nr:TIGR04255 family protein [Ralstonia insidiosa]
MRDPVRFAKPPIFEVACGVLFSSSQPIASAHVGAYWQRIRSKFPRSQDVAPLPTVIEQAAGVTSSWVEFANLPPLRRSWFINEDGRNLIQLQSDRFLFNWQRASNGDAYPSYGVVIEQFESHLRDFMDFCREIGVGELAFKQFELVYVNLISQSNGLDVTGFDSLLTDHVRSGDRSRFLPEVDGFNWATAYSLPDGKGRLHVLAQSALNQPGTERPVRLELAARGISADTSDSGRRQWFDTAHEWITRGFVDVTNPKLHSDAYWKRES